MRSHTTNATVSTQPDGGFPTWSANTLLQTSLLQRTEAVLRVQEKLLGGFEAMSRNWMEHRQDDIRSALSTVKRMEAMEDAAERSSLWSEWMADRMKRWSEEASEAMERAQSVSRTMAEQASAGTSADRSRRPRDRSVKDMGVVQDTKAEAAQG
ncbi:hypothetical protein [Azospirillum endophyticum]